MWMVRFKQLSAFALFAAAVFFTQSVDQRNVLPLLYATVGIGLALWMIGAMYDHASSFATKSKVRIAALLFGGGICFYAWSLHIDATMPTTHHLPWKAFREDTLLELRTAGKPALIDFTADWCLICKTNERIALNTEQTAKYVKDKGIVTLVADWTNKSEEIRKWLNKFNRDSVPLTVIVPPNPEAKLIVLAGAYTQGQLLEKLDEAMKQAKPVVAAVPAQPAGEPAKVAAVAP
jgi:thiol:disulfide interchange protein DsbD